MTATAAAAAARSRPNDGRLILRQTYYEQLTFWRNPFGAVFTIGFSTLFLVLLSATGSGSRLEELGGIRFVQFYAPGFIAYGVMSACFNTLGITLINRREMGLLKRLRLSPLPAWIAMAAIFLSALIVALVQVGLLLAIGRLAYHLQFPHNWLALGLAVLVGDICFTALGVAATTFIPNQDAAGPALSIVFFVLLFLSGLWFPLEPGSGLAEISSFFPIRHMIVAVFAPFDLRPGASSWAWGHLGVMALWGVAATVIALRRFRWEPRRA